MTVSASIELFSARVCPYAHRTRLVLAEKGLGIRAKAKPDVHVVRRSFQQVPQSSDLRIVPIQAAAPFVANGNQNLLDIVLAELEGG